MSDRPKVNHEDFRGKPIGDYLAARGVKENPARAKELAGTTVVRFSPRKRRKAKP